MRFNRLLHLIAFPGKALGEPPASGPETGNRSETAGASRADRSTGSRRYLPLSTPPPPTFAL